MKLERKRLRITFPVNKGQPRYNPDEKRKFEHYVARGGCSMIVEEDYAFLEEWPQAQVGLLTSAYLFAFHTFGYRYLFQACLDPIRQLIADSFDARIDSGLDLEESVDTAVWSCPDCDKDDPEIACVLFSGSPQTPPHLLVGFRQYHIRLPLPLERGANVPPERELAALRKQLRDLNGEIRMDLSAGDIDEVVKQPDYCVEGYTLKAQVSRFHH
ncbi:MAG TPA: hypothetical protein VMW58_04995 [Anaerolineae bacterium]|nr:hypothetical protein [Anaerolineae bacterium]